MTTTAQRSLEDVLNEANPNLLASALQALKLGRMLSPLKVVVASLGSTAVVDITSAGVQAKATVTGMDSLGTKENLPPILCLRGGVMRVTGGSAPGPYALADAGATAFDAGGASATAGVASLSDDGKTITFKTAVTDFVIEYMPRAFTDLATAQPL